MKKIYNAPEMQIIEQIAEPIMLDASIEKGGELKPTDPIDSKGTTFEDEEDDNDWNGWN